MAKPRYDENENISRHAATRPGDCERMARKYGWKLIAIELVPEDPILKIEIECGCCGVKDVLRVMVRIVRGNWLKSV